MQITIDTNVYGPMFRPDSRKMWIWSVNITSHGILRLPLIKFLKAFNEDMTAELETCNPDIIAQAKTDQKRLAAILEKIQDIELFSVYNIEDCFPSDETYKLDHYDRGMICSIDIGLLGSKRKILADNFDEMYKKLEFFID